MPQPLPPIANAAKRLTVQIERAVAAFPRYHKYAVGADLRAEARSVNRCAHRAWRDPANQLQRVEQLSQALDELKLTLQTAMELHAFRSFGEFEDIARNAFDLGRQCGGWLKSLRQKSQNDRVKPSSGQRAQILSSRAASGEAQL
ncbi:MAG: four helix bundle protein [Terriglobales bacterium]